MSYIPYTKLSSGRRHRMVNKMKVVHDKLTVFGLNQKLEPSSIIINASNKLNWYIIPSEKRKGEYIIVHSSQWCSQRLYITASERTKILKRYEALKAKYV